MVQSRIGKCGGLRHQESANFRDEALPPPLTNGHKTTPFCLLLLRGIQGERPPKPDLGTLFRKLFPHGDPQTLKVARVEL